MKSYYASAEREEKEKLSHQVNQLENNEFLHLLADSVPEILMVLNDKREIVFANQRLYEYLDISDGKEVLGMRPGELFDCENALRGPSGCGTSKLCRTCGAVNAILEAQAGSQSVQECSIITREKKALELKVMATPYQADNSNFTIFSLSDISHEKQRRNLERMFFHDVLNTAGGILGNSYILQDETDREESCNIAKRIYAASELLIEEIQLQRLLLEDEKGKLETTYSQYESRQLLEDVVTLYQQHPVARNKQVTLAEDASHTTFATDSVLFKRVLSNMVKNALEASSAGASVTVTAADHEADLVFSVHNATAIPPDVQLQIFKRSFSTKGPGRGIGTYSIRVLGEKYLQGRVWFESSEETGTRFFLSLPRTPDQGR